MRRNRGAMITGIARMCKEKSVSLLKIETKCRQRLVQNYEKSVTTEKSCLCWE